MTNRIWPSILVLVLSATVSATVPTAPPEATAAPESPASTTFANQVDLEPLRSLAVHTDGRVKSFETFARGMMRFVSGRHRIDEQEHTFTYLDLMLRPERYADRSIIYIKKKLVRTAVSYTHLRAHETV